MQGKCWCFHAIAVVLLIGAQSGCDEIRVHTINYTCAQGVDLFWEEAQGPGDGLPVDVRGSLDPAALEDVQVWSRSYDYPGQPYNDPGAFEFSVIDDYAAGGTEQFAYGISDAYQAPWEIRTHSDRAGSATLTLNLGTVAAPRLSLSPVPVVYPGPCE